MTYQGNKWKHFGNILEIFWKYFGNILETEMGKTSKKGVCQV
jgi:hypothetical protein